VTTSARPRISPYAWFAGSAGAWFLAAGMQQVLFAWLVVGELRESPQWLGAAQMCQTLPALVFLLVGGAIADRFDRRRILLGLHVAAAVAVGGMSLAVAHGLAGLFLLLAYGLAWGTLQALAQPARDALLSDVAGDDLMRAVTGVTLTQFVATALGSRLAGIGAWLGNAAALGLQATLLVVGLLPASRLPRTAPAPRPRPSLSMIREGLREVWESERLFPIALLVAADGLFYMGPFFVLLPLLVRDAYNGGISELSLVMMTLTLGTILGSSLVLLRGGIHRRGRAFLLALLGIAVCLVSFQIALPFPGFVAVVFAWGIGHSVFFNTSRTLFQEVAPASHRARVLSVHSLGFLGMAPISNLGAGFLANLVGPRAGCALAGSIMLVIVTLAWLYTGVRRMQ
jgi:MFS family permease